MDNTHSSGGATGDLEADVARATDTLTQIVQFVRTATAQVVKGEDVDLTGLDTRVQTVCETILAFPQEHALAYESALQQLSTDLITLQQSLEAAQAQIGGELGGLDAHQSAAKAYKKADSEE